MTLPPLPCFSICRPAARAINHDCVTLASMTSRKSSAFWSTIFDTLFWPDATTRMSTPPKPLHRRVDDGRRNWPPSSAAWRRRRTLPPPSFRIRPRLFSGLGAVGADHDIGAGAGEHLAASAPNAPVAPVTIAVLPLTLNSDSGSFRKSSDMMSHHLLDCHARDRAGTQYRNPRCLLDRPPRAGDDTCWLYRSSAHLTPAAQQRRLRWCRPIAAIDNLTALVRPDVAAIAPLHRRSPCCWR